MDAYNFVLIFIPAFLWRSVDGLEDEYRCCPPTEWEGNMHMSAASEIQFYDVLMYTNGTIHIAYSVPLQKIYLGMQLVQEGSYFPKENAFNATYLYDFQKGITYEVTSIDNNCTKSNILINSTQQCIPADASLLSQTYLGDDNLATVSTLRFKIPTVGFTWHVTVTVHETETPGLCYPVHVVYVTDVEAKAGGLIGASLEQRHKCCVPAEWEGHMHISEASELNMFHNLVFTNASAHIAYSVPLQKIYLGMHMYQISLFLPNATMKYDANVTILYDFEKGISYEITSDDNNCSKDEIPVNATSQCVPADASLQSKSFLGDDAQSIISTYRFTIPTSVALPWHVTATVHEKGTSGVCDPIHVVYATDVESEIGGVMYSLDVFDIRPLSSTNFFKVPKQCLQ